MLCPTCRNECPDEALYCPVCQTVFRKEVSPAANPAPALPVLDVEDRGFQWGLIAAAALGALMLPSLLYTKTPPISRFDTAAPFDRCQVSGCPREPAGMSEATVTIPSPDGRMGRSFTTTLAFRLCEAHAKRAEDGRRHRTGTDFPWRLLCWGVLSALAGLVGRQAAGLVAQRGAPAGEP